MSETTENRVKRPRGTDHLGFLNSTLRNLLGYSTLAHELIQNADDAPNTTSMSFDVRDDGVIVDNDGLFTDCGELDSEEWRLDCPWKHDDQRRRMCDFHRFQCVASGDKQGEADTTGAFGIGFTAVYQITDRPELISNGRHWLLFEERSEDERIEECARCPQCEGPGIPNTRFILPWANDPDSVLRRRLDVEPVTTGTPERILAELIRSVPLAMLFLKKLNKITIARNGESVKEYERAVEGDSLIVGAGRDAFVWHVLRTEFDAQAQRLRHDHPAIEPKRSADVAIAIPEDAAEDGLFCAFLPTRHRTGLPFHINADFYPKSDRKEIILDDDYKAEWNRAAIAAAGEVFSEKLEWVRDKVGHKQLWRIIQAIKEVGDKAESGGTDSSLGQFWGNVQTALGTSDVIFTSTGEWVAAGEALLLGRDDELQALPILESFGLRLVHTDIRFAWDILRSKIVGVRLLDGEDLAVSLLEAGLSERREIANLPAALKKPGAMQVLWTQIDRLLAQRVEASRRSAMVGRLAQCAIAPGQDGAFWPCEDVYRADDRTVRLFQPLLSSVTFQSPLEEPVAALDQLCPLFDAEAAIRELEQVELGRIEQLVAEGTVDLAKLIGWFEDQRAVIIESDDLSRRLSALPIFPSTTGPRPLAELSLPGGFRDPLDLANTVNTSTLAERIQFLHDLGAKYLSFIVYARDHVPRALEDDNLAPEKRREAIKLLAERLGVIRDDATTQCSLAAVAVVECQDGSFRHSADVYLPTPVVAEVLGSNALLARIPHDHRDAITEFYRWLGVAERPRLSAVVTRIKAITSDPPNGESIQAIRVLFDHLVSRLDDEDAEDELSCLRTTSWLPARGDRDEWHLPEDVYADFTAYLFESQVLFLDVPQRSQQAGTALLQFLGISSAPTEKQVVAHLLHCAEEGIEVNRQVYRWLNDRADAPAVARLVGQRCLIMSDGEYVRPEDVFWQPHPFGHYRRQLGEKFREYYKLLARLDVDENPKYSDALDVLREIAEDFGTDNRTLDDETRSIAMNCWRMLCLALENEQVAANELADLAKEKVICAPNNLLSPPEWMFFDDRPGLAAKFNGFLQNSAIQRPQGAWQAMAAAGVQPLSSAVESHLAERVDPTDDDAILNVVRQRREQLVRVLEFVRPGLADNLARLDAIHCCAVSELVVTYTVQAYRQQRQSAPEPVQAHYLRDESTLYFVRTDSRLNWTAVARELATIVRSEEEPGSLASLLKEVLAAESVQAAEETLDELDIPRIDSGVGLTNVPSAVEDDLGGVVDISDEEGFDLEGQEVDESPPEETGPQTTDEAIESLLGGGAGPPPMPPELDKPDRPPGAGGPGATGAGPGTGPGSAGDGDGHPGGPRPKGPRKGYSVLYSYVMPDRPDDDAPTDDEAHSRRSKVDQAGVDRVEQFEEDNERRPKIMPHKHPGYDVESYGGDGDIERYIEVKSLSGDWVGADARLTKTQFKKAMELRDRYWLYVVERAEQDDYCIHCIQDPAGKANRFMFDPGWKQVAQETSDDDNPEDDG